MYDILRCILNYTFGAQVEIDSLDQLVGLIRKTRRDQGITQEQLADFTGLQRIGIVKIESGKTEPKVCTLLKICKMLGLKIEISGAGEE